MEFGIGDPVVLDGTLGVVVARVRADDDPRKCVPAGSRLTLRGTIAERDQVTYLVRPSGVKRVIWSHNKDLTGIVPTVPVASATAAAGRVAADVMSISDGTMAALTGYRQTADIIRVRQAFAQHVIGAEDSGTRFGSWLAAFRWFLNGAPGEALPLFDEKDRMFLREHSGAVPSGVEAWIGPNGDTWISKADRPFRLDTGWPVLGEADGLLIRAGFVRRHWYVGKQRAAFEAWLG
ncbi:hypothetical protein E4T66_17610 [Sinimarinibacterium sp. CAU 1509]|uniref:hypothetical protein n=1 Tax=Sinimarinibacterium sp. CAU 1509 TaxID=2562283 RepID=UPI0010ABF676|nr:hypothetical protein [Sinimarinibacterium sp. CAU 1509]TJY57225.1 hypothetical protein E4T66_17610 [Sinimarinibacterium sp. CAU 1509]